MKVITELSSWVVLDSRNVEVARVSKLVANEEQVKGFANQLAQWEAEAWATVAARYAAIEAEDAKREVSDDE